MTRHPPAWRSGGWRLARLFAAALSFAATFIADAGEQPRPNVLLIIGDDMAWTDYGFMGHPEIRTPHLDRLAREGVVFRRGYVTASLCSPSLASLITGHYPHQTLITGNEPPMPVRAASKRYADPAFLGEVRALYANLGRFPVLPGELGRSGYRSLQTGKWWGGSYRNGGFTEGMSAGDPEHGGRHGDAGLKIGRETMGPIHDFIRRTRDAGQPFFVWYAPMMPHDPHTPPERLLAKYHTGTNSIHTARYRAMCEWFDETCGDLLGFLDRENLATNTLVVCLADNGWLQKPDAPGCDMTRSKNSPFDGGLRTPVILRWPGRIAPRFDDTPVSSVDLYPTIARACGVDPPAGLPGVDLLDSAALASHGPVFGSVGHHNAIEVAKPGRNTRWRFMVEGGWKLIDPNPPEPGAPRLFRITEDPMERDDLAAAHPERVAAMRKRLDAWWNPAIP